MWGYLVATLLGILAGIFTGLAPGVHINLVATLLFGMSAYLLEITSATVLCVFIVSMSIAHTFLNAIPAIYLGAPVDEGEALNVLPGHRMLLQGKGYEALVLTVIGSFSALIIGILSAPLIIMFLPKIYDFLKEYIGYILILIVLFLVLREKKKYWAFFVFILAGVYGLAALNLNLSNAMFPMLSSLFGTAGLLISLKDKVKIPKQLINKTDIKKKEVIKAVSAGTLVGSFVSMLPGLGPAQAAIIGSQIVKLSDKGFLVLVGGLDTLSTIIGFVALYAIDKTRNGTVVIISRLMETVTIKDMILFFGVSLFAGIVAAVLSLVIARKFSSWITKIDYSKTCIGIIVLITGMTIWLSGFLGLYVLIIGSFLGMVPVLLGIGRNHLMGCLLLPVILFFIL